MHLEASIITLTIILSQVFIMTIAASYIAMTKILRIKSLRLYK